MAKQDKQKAAIIESLEAGASRTRACQGAGLARRTFYNWLREDDAFRKEVERAEQEVIQTVESVALACALKAEEDPKYQTSMIFWLKANAGWKETTRVEVDDRSAGETRADILGRIGSLTAGAAASGGAEDAADA